MERPVHNGKTGVDRRERVGVIRHSAQALETGDRQWR